MIEAVIKQDLEEFNDHIKALREKYGSDFHFFGFFGVEGDENYDEGTPVYGTFAMVGKRENIHKGLHHVLSHEPGVEAFMDALRCHCKHELPMYSENTTDLRDKVLLLIQKELVRKARVGDAEIEVDELLDSLGFKH